MITCNNHPKTRSAVRWFCHRFCHGFWKMWPLGKSWVSWQNMAKSDRQEVCPFPSPIYPNLRFRSMRSKSKVCGAQNRTDPYKPTEIESLSIISLAILAAETINWLTETGLHSSCCVGDRYWNTPFDWPVPKASFSSDWDMSHCLVSLKSWNASWSYQH